MQDLLDQLVKDYVNIKLMQSKMIDRYKEGSEYYSEYFKSVLASNDTVRMINEIKDFNSEKVQNKIKKLELELEVKNVALKVENLELGDKKE